MSSKPTQRQQLFKFLGPRNFKGYNSKNMLARTPAHAKFNVRQSRLGSWSDQGRNGQAGDAKTSFEIFQDNPFTKTNKLLSRGLVQRFVKLAESGVSPQKISIDYQLSVPRVEAALKLEEIRAQMWKKVSKPASKRL